MNIIWEPTPMNAGERRGQFPINLWWKHNSACNVYSDCSDACFVYVSTDATVTWETALTCFEHADFQGMLMKIWPWNLQISDFDCFQVLANALNNAEMWLILLKCWRCWLISVSAILIPSLVIMIFLYILNIILRTLYCGAQWVLLLSISAYFIFNFTVPASLSVQLDHISENIIPE